MRKIFRISILLLLVIITGCSSNSGDYPSEYPASEAKTKEQILWPQYSQVSVLSDGVFAQVDISNASQGYIGARLLTSGAKIKLQIEKDGLKYNYDLVSADYTAFPLQMGNGVYTIKILQQIEGTKYAVSASTQLNVALENDKAPYLYPNQVVNYHMDSLITNKSFEVTQGDTDDLHRILHMFEYVVDVLNYDYEKADYVSDTYVLPNIDESISKGSGICFDYASALAAMCRVQGIPAKVIVGWTDIEYHAWVEIYLENEGWVNPKTYFKGQDWAMMDPTFADSNNADYEGRYEEVYHY